MPNSILFWRSMTQWLGGMGIVVLALAILPRLSVGGQQLMNVESPGPEAEKLTPADRRDGTPAVGALRRALGL